MEFTFVQFIFLILIFFLIFSFALFFISDAVLSFLKIKRLLRKG